MKYLFISQPVPNTPPFKLIIKWQHGDADGNTTTSLSFTAEEDFIKHLDFYFELKRRSYEYHNSSNDIYTQIAQTYFGVDVETYGLIEDDIHYSDGWAVVDDIDVEINGVPHAWNCPELSSEISLPVIGGLVQRSTWNTNKIDNSKWFTIPKGADYFKYSKENTEVFIAKVVSVKVDRVYPEMVIYTIVGEVANGTYKGELCHWDMKGIDLKMLEYVL